MLATFVVNDVGDAGDPFTGDTLCDTANNPNSNPPVQANGICTLRAAVESANGNPGPDTITFNIPGGGIPTINLAAAAPTVNSALIVGGPVTIDGTTQPGGGTVELRSPVGVLQLLGGSDGSTVTGLVINNSGGGIAIVSNNNTIIGNQLGTDPTGTAAMPITGTAIGIVGNNNRIEDNLISGSGAGISIAGAGPIVPTGNVIEGNLIGTDTNGTAAIGNTVVGVDIRFAQDNTVGPDNVISGNGTGVTIVGDTAAGNVVAGNFIGTDITGAAALGNGAGVLIDDAPMNLIGGELPNAPGIVEGNVISSSTGVNVGFGFGVQITNENATGNVVQGNVIGTNAAGTAALPNVSDAIHIADAGGNTIGGADDATRNIISGNGGDGVLMVGTVQDITTGNVVTGNYIGTDVTGMVGLPNGARGVHIDQHATQNIIGGVAAGERNIISGNDSDGVIIALETATLNRVIGNYIGVAVDGSTRVPNQGNGIFVLQASGNQLGGAADREGNVISANGLAGVRIQGATAQNNSVEGSFIGTDTGGAAPLGNGEDGVAIINAPNNTVGGAAAGARNIISANTLDGVSISGMPASGNDVHGNFIGTDVNGTASLSNADDGVSITGAPDNSIGGLNPGERNLISSNDASGVLITGMEATGNTVQGNRIGTDVNGTAAMGNGDEGITIDDAPDNFIGGSNPGEGNLISANDDDGVLIRGTEATGNTVQGNRIGTDVNGTAPLGNGDDGVSIEDASDNSIGGLAPNARNLISANDRNGIYISGNEATGNTVQGNLIGTDANESAELGNGNDGVRIDEAPGNTVGGGALGAQNTISGNADAGVFIDGSDAAMNRVQGNLIGVTSDGNALGNGGDGVVIEDAPGNTIGGMRALDQGNVISGNGEVGVVIIGFQASGNLVEGNLIGTHQLGLSCDEPGGAAGNQAMGNDSEGVEIDDAPGNIVENNVISCNAFNGILILGNDAELNSVQDNLIGTDISGTVRLANGRSGIEIDDAPDNLLVANVISGNTLDGVLITGSDSVSNELHGNFIGTDINGMNALGNNHSGVQIDDASGNTIGGASDAEGNLIAFNLLAGISVNSGTGTSIGVNSIHGNVDLGIDLNAVEGAPDGVTSNDPGDTDDGANGLQNFPVITGFAGTPTRITGTLNSIPDSEFLIRFYNNTTSDPSGFGEGERFLGEITVTTDAQGDIAFDETLSNTEAVSGCVTATAEHVATSNTSEFSACFSAIVVNEVDYDQSGVDDAEFIELKNNNESLPIDLDGMEIQLIDGDGGGASVYQTIDLPAVDLSPGDYFVICSDADNVPNCDLVLTLGSDFIQDGAPDAVALVLGSSILDSVSYGGDTGGPYTEGSGVGLVDDPNLDSVGISRLPDGQDSDRNNIDFVASEVTPGAANSQVAVLDVTGNGIANPFQDGILIVRFMLNQPDENLEDPLLIPDDATRTTGAEIRAFLEATGDALDVNGDGNINPFQDGILIVRFLLGQPEENLEDPLLIPPGSTRTTGAAIVAYLQTLLPPPAGSALLTSSGGEGETTTAFVTATDSVRVIDVIRQDGADDGDPKTHKIQVAANQVVSHRPAANRMVQQVVSTLSKSRLQQGSEAVDRLLSDQAFLEGLF